MSYALQCAMHIAQSASHSYDFMMWQVCHEVEGRGLVKLKQAVSVLQLARACDHENVTQLGLKALRKAMADGTSAIGYPVTSHCPMVPQYRVALMQQAVSMKLDDFGIEQYPKNTVHPGWHVTSLQPTMRMCAMQENLCTTVSSKKDVLYGSLLFDGAEMTGAKNAVLGFLNFCCFNKLKDGKLPHGQMSEHNQCMIAAAELKQESHANLKSMMDSWLTPEVNAFEKGLVKLKPVMDNLKVLRKSITTAHELLQRRSGLPAATREQASNATVPTTADLAESAAATSAAQAAAAAAAAASFMTKATTAAPAQVWSQQ